MDRDGPEMAARLEEIFRNRELARAAELEKFGQKTYDFSGIRYGAVALGVLVLLIGAYEMRKHVPKQPHSRSAVVHAVDDLEISRHRHDGAQPDTENVRPGQHTTVTWEPRL